MYVLLTEDDAELVLKATSGVRPEGAALEMGLEGAPVGGRGVYADLGGSPYNIRLCRPPGSARWSRRRSSSTAAGSGC